MRWEPERGPALFRGGIGLSKFSYPRLVSVLYLAPFLFKMKFINEKLFPLVSVIFWGVLTDFQIQLISPLNMLSQCVSNKVN